MTLFTRWPTIHRSFTGVVIACLRKIDMDPNATLRRIADLMHEEPGELTEECLAEACQDMREWLAKGGFEPQWEKSPFAAAHYRRWEAENA